MSQFWSCQAVSLTIFDSRIPDCQGKKRKKYKTVINTSTATRILYESLKGHIDQLRVSGSKEK